MLSILKREFPDGNFQSLFEGTSRVVPPSSATVAADPLLSSFVTPMADELFISESGLYGETSSAKKASNQSLPERYCFLILRLIRTGYGYSHCVALS